MDECFKPAAEDLERNEIGRDEMLAEKLTQRSIPVGIRIGKLWQRFLLRGLTLLAIANYSHSEPGCCFFVVEVVRFEFESTDREMPVCSQITCSAAEPTIKISEEIKSNTYKGSRLHTSELTSRKRQPGVAQNHMAYSAAIWNAKQSTSFNSHRQISPPILTGNA